MELNVFVAVFASCVTRFGFIFAVIFPPLYRCSVVSIYVTVEGFCRICYSLLWEHIDFFTITLYDRGVVGSATVDELFLLSLSVCCSGAEP